jgi:hypothetical protein
MKVLSIQFGTMVNWIQMKSMKLICTVKNGMIQDFQWYSWYEYNMVSKRIQLIDDWQYQ